MSANANTVSQDFCLFEADEASFDYPLFAEGIKLQQQQHQLLQEHSQHLLSPEQPVQQQYQQSSSTTTPSNPLCTPQTPSLDLLEHSNNRGNDSFGLYGYSTFVDDSNGCLNDAAAIALAHRNDSISAGNSAAQQPSVPTLVCTPFAPCTPFETPYLADFEVDGQRASAALVDEGHDRRNHGCSYPAAISLFSELDFDVSASLAGCPYGTIEPATLFMATSSSPSIKEERGFETYQRGITGIVDSSPGSSSHPATPSIQGNSSHNCSFDSLFYEYNQDRQEEEEEEENNGEDSEADSSEDSCDDADDDREFIPLRPQAMSGFKRKALDAFTSGGVSCNLDNAASSNSGYLFKRTRPELASPSGGKKRSLKTKKTAATKRFTCAYPSCERRFARLFNLHTHEKTHDPHQVRPFVCDAIQCGKRFSRKHDLQRHEASVHKGERNYCCPTCRKPFSRQDGLRRHLTVRGSICAAVATGIQDDILDETEIGWIPT
ncbi:hypothetical protein BGZ99_007094 [Dissophora globulifera]|uniref:C2H2-type domain-containing protein n=1 Tax=Dissophora globulifera TaxID=979702 RepID=A0A9P6V0P7_9FUNG|nr:hypothetical protein BGZ99_007094 [Dissophora globulifera]